MGYMHDKWLWLWKRVSPQVDSRQIETILAEAKHSLPTPVLWMLGKVQQGKTSIIRGLSGRSDAEIGKGFRACTRTSHVYAYPDEEGCFLKFLDTRGLGEVGYDPADDLEAFADQSHCIIVVLNAMDHAQQEVLHALRDDPQAAPPLAGGRMPDDAPCRLSARSAAYRSLSIRPESISGHCASRTGPLVAGSTTMV